MGQYWKVVNLDKKEFVHPHKLGCGLKLWEQLANHPGTGAALIILTAAMPESRGSGDLDLESVSKPTPGSYQEIVKRTIGRWVGDRIALIGDYAEREDLPPEDNADLIYELSGSEQERQNQIAYLKAEVQKANDGDDKDRLEDKVRRLEASEVFKDISSDVCTVIEHELNGKFTGDGWREFKYSGK